MEKLIGILIEPRKLKQIHYIIENFFEVLPNVKLYFFCGKNLKKYYKSCFELHYNLNIIELEVDDLTSISYSDILKSFDFWNQFDAEYALTIQTDGCLCKKSNLQIDDFFEYDFIGGYALGQWKQLMAPIIDVNNHFPCFNGGFSLRNISKCLSVLTSFPPLLTSNETCDFKKYPEDIYFVYGMLQLGFKVGIDYNATTFCTHKHFVKNSFCIHNFFQYAENNALEECFDYCPEYKDFVNIELYQPDIKDDNNELRVGVVIASYSTNKNIGKCLKSVFKQTYPHYSIIVIGNDYTRLYEIGKLVAKINKNIKKKVFFYNIERTIFNDDKNSYPIYNRTSSLLRSLLNNEINYFTYLDNNVFWKPTRLQIIINTYVCKKVLGLK